MNEYDVNSENVKKKIKPHKKSVFSKIVLFVVAALLFGILSGAVFQGYNYFTRSKPLTVYDDNDDNNRMQDNGEDNVINDDGVEKGNEVDNNEETIITSEDDSDASISTSLAMNEAIKKGIVTDVSDVVDNVMSSIVAINKTATIKDYDFFFGEYSQEVKGSGSGIIIGQNNNNILLVTNNHVIEGADKVEIIFTDDSSAQAVVKGADARTDLAILEVDMDDLTKDTLDVIKVASIGDSNKIKAGEMAIAIGNALGYGQSVTVGYISAINREVYMDNMKMTLIQTDAAINPGNSGGALINALGEVIGINSMKYASTKVEGMGYAIPISDAIPMINKLMNEKVQDVDEQGFLGINLQTAQNVTQEYAVRFNMPIGVYINDVVVDSPAIEAGLKKGHIITGIDNMSVETIDDLINYLSYTKPQDEVILNIQTIENGQYVEKELNVILSERP